MLMPPTEVHLKIKDVDLRARQCIVLGKGNKIRTAHFGTTTGSALPLYLRSHSEDREEPLFLADKSGGKIRPLTDSVLRQLLERLGKRPTYPAVAQRMFCAAPSL